MSLPWDASLSKLYLTLESFKPLQRERSVYQALPTITKTTDNAAHIILCIPHIKSATWTYVSLVLAIWSTLMATCSSCSLGEVQINAPYAKKSLHYTSLWWSVCGISCVTHVHTCTVTFTSKTFAHVALPVVYYASLALKIHFSTTLFYGKMPGNWWLLCQCSLICTAIALHGVKPWPHIVLIRTVAGGDTTILTRTLHIESWFTLYR